MFVLEAIYNYISQMLASIRRFSTTVPPPPVKKVKPPKNPTNLLILSLGNPAEYNGTRHSIGHYVSSKLQSRYRASSTRVGRFESSIVTVNDTKLWFYRVPGYMNLSGKSVTPFYKEFTKTVDDFQTIILFDELDVELGDVKVRKRGSSHRGHNGLRDIQSSMIGKEYTGLQLGIGRNYSGDKSTKGVVADYVLSKFKRDELEVIDDETVAKVMHLLEDMTHGKYIYDRVKN